MFKMRPVVKTEFKRAASIAALLLFAFLPSAHAKMRLERLMIEPAAGGAAHAFDIELASTDQEKAVGLMFRTKLADSEGMLFPYGNPQVLTMWMHNTYIALDMVFVRADGVIHRIESAAEPLSDRVISSGAPVTAVLELAGGATARLGIKPGDRVLHAAFDATKKP
jgi:uncharacterized protein